MTIKITEHQRENDDKGPFPKLVYGNIFDKKQIVLVTGYNKESRSYVGTNVNGVGWPLGYYSKGWDENMKDYIGSVTITNE